MNRLGQFTQGLQTGLGLGAQWRQMRRQNAMDQLLQQHGPGLVRGDRSAISALARYSPQTALGFQQVADSRRKAQREQLLKQQAMVGGLLAGVLEAPEAQRPQMFEAAKAYAAQQGLLSPEEAQGLTFDQLPMIVNQHLGVKGVIEKSQAGREFDLATQEHKLAFGKFALEKVLPALAAGAGAGQPITDGQPPRVASAPPQPYGAPGVTGTGPQPDSFANAVMMAESGGRDVQGPVVTGGANAGHRAQGRMQVMPKTAQDPGFGVRPLDPNAADPNAEMARVGRDYLDAMLQRYGGDMEAAAIAYNAGPANADRWLEAGRDYSVLPDRAQTEQYVQRVMSQMGEGAPQQPPQQPGQPPQPTPQGGVAASAGALRTLGVDLPQGVENMPPAQQAALQRMAQSGQDPTTLMQNLEAAGYQPGTPEYQDAARESLNPATQLMRHAQEAGLQPGSQEYREFIAQNAAKSGMAVEFTPDGGFRMVQGPAAGDGFQRSTRGSIERDVIDGTDILARVNAAQSAMDPNMLSFSSRLSTNWDRVEDWFGTASPEQREQVAKFADMKSKSADLMNRIIKILSGAAVNAQEAVRMEQVLPTVGKTMFDGDSPTEFATKMKSLREQTILSVARYNYWRLQGASGNPWDIAEISDMKSFMRKSLGEFEADFRSANPDVADEAVKAALIAERKRRFGI